MTEYFTEALVLENETNGELDAKITLYTRELGKIIAKAKSIRKTTSKLAGHLQPLNFADVRLIEKNGFQIVDALTTNSLKNPENFRKFLNIAEFIKNMTYEFQEDQRFWQAIKKIFNSDFEEKIIYRGLLKILGFDTQFATCASCHKNKIQFFLKTDHIFLCENCGSKNNKNEVILIK